MSSLSVPRKVTLGTVTSDILKSHTEELAETMDVARLPLPVALLQQRTLVLFFDIFSRHNNGRCNSVVAIEVQQFDALRGAARLANGLSVDANHFARLRNNHQL